MPARQRRARRFASSTSATICRASRERPSFNGSKIINLKQSSNRQSEIVQHERLSVSAASSAARSKDRSSTRTTTW